MSYRERLKPLVTLISPSKNVFRANWIGNSRNAKNSLGISKYPNRPGVYIQNQGIGGTEYQLTIYFTGDDNDLEAERFFQACRESGEWEVDHPVLGLLKLQMVDVVDEIEPVRSGNVRKVTVNFIEGEAKEKVISVAQTQIFVATQTEVVNSSSSTELVNNISQKKPTERQEIINVSKSLIQRINDFLGPLYALNNEINSLVNSIQRSINEVLTAVTIEPLLLARQFQQLIQLPTLVTRNIQSRIQAFEDLVTSVIEDLPIGNAVKDKNRASLVEMSLGAIIGAGALTVTTGDLKSRREALEMTDRLSSLFKLVVDSLDEKQELFEGTKMGARYFSQTNSYADLSLLVANALDYLLRISFDLRIEKRFILFFDTATMKVVINEYGELGENDINYDLFVETNGLLGNEMLLLPSGKELVVYV